MHQSVGIRLERYQQELLLALRMCKLPAPRIAEALAEVESHVIESGEDPRLAFGEPVEYANELARVLGRRRGGWRTTFAALTRSAIAAAVLFAAAVALLVRGLHQLLTGQSNVVGSPAFLLVILGQVTLLSVAMWLIVRRRRKGDRVIDPRTGAEMAPPVPQSAIAIIAVGPLILVLVALLLVASET